MASTDQTTRQIIKDRKIVDDGWIHLTDDAPLPAQGNVTVSFARWQQDRDTLLARSDQTGVRLAPADEPQVLADDLPRLALVAVTFPKFTDGRGYSQARMLRDRLGFTGELRAIGHVLRDQLFYLHRCGFNAFELASGKSLEDAMQAFADFSVTYQGAADDPRPLFRRRSGTPT